MGHNIDLQWLMGLPEFYRCPLCKEMTPTYFEEYDIDCGSPEAKAGQMWLDVQCRHCQHDFRFGIKIELLKPIPVSFSR